MEIGLVGKTVGNGAGFVSGEYEEYLKLKVELKQRRVEDMVKTLGNNKGAWRQIMALRRINVKVIVPDEDLVAYGALHKLKNHSGDSKQKTSVSENEIAAYKALDPDFNKNNITLAEVIDKVNELKEAGTLSTTGDTVGEEESD